MHSKHVKSPCCGAKVRRFGKRRRQCCSCNKTWSIRQKKRGRPRHRTSADCLQKVFFRGFSLTQLHSARISVNLPAYRYRFRQFLQRFLSKPYAPKIPDGPLVLLADGVWFQFNRKHWVLYMAALKPCSGKTAVFLRPQLHCGRESANNWQKMFASIPNDNRARICAIVGDNLRGMQAIADDNNWLLQLCQFHMLIKLQVRRKGISRKLIGGSIREELYDLISCVMRTKDAKKYKTSIARLEELAKQKCGTKRIRSTVREFLACVGYYRTFLDYPNLHLPTTTNTMESMGNLLRAMFRRSHAGSNPKSLLMWAEAMLRVKGKLACNGYEINR